MEKGKSTGGGEESNMMNNNNGAPPPKPPANTNSRQNLPPGPQICPRCDSSNTKFCYFNNYSQSQPRFFCKSCRRYWTHGGTLRNVPVGGGCRKSKRPKTSASGSGSSSASTQSMMSTGMMVNASGQSNLTAPNLVPLGNIGNSFYNPNATPFLSSLASMQLPGQVNFAAGGPSMSSFLQGMNFNHANLIPQNNPYFVPQQRPLIPQRPLNSWTQGFVNRSGGSSAAAGGSGFYGGGGVGGSGGGGGGEGSSAVFNPNDWSDQNLPGFDPNSDQ